MAVALLVATAATARADVLDDLYSKRLLFDAAGRPVVPVGLMEKQARVVLRGATSIAIGDAAPVPVPPGAAVVVEDQGGKPAPVEKLVVVETLEGDARARRNDVVAAWADKGVAVSLVPAGGTYGVRGTVVDVRALLVVATPPVDDKTLAQAGARPVVVERATRVPVGRMRVVVGDAAPKTAPWIRATGGPITVERVEHSRGYAQHGYEDRTFSGEVLVVPGPTGALAAVNLVHEDVLVSGILPSEMFPNAPIEALKAQAVTARGELFAKIGRRHFADPFLVCSEQHCQVYKGTAAETPNTARAAAETRGELAFVDDELVDSVYSACCGGHTEPADVVWDRPPKSALRGVVDAPYADPATRPWLDPLVSSSPLYGRADHAAAATVPVDLRDEADVRRFLALPRDAAWCGRSTFNQKGDAYRWERRFAKADLDAAFADLGVGAVRRIAVEERGAGGRLRALVVEGDKKTARVLRELPVRRRLGNLRSGLFVVDEERAADGALVAVVLRGAGYGHGAGMCQQGAIGMAEGGKTYREILRHYYPGAEVRSVF